MAAKKKPIDPDVVDTIWVAGVLSMSGSLTLVTTKHAKVVRLVVSSGVYPESMERLSKYMGSKLFTVSSGQRISIQGAALHSLMTKVWEYLPRERKRQYAKFRSEITTTLEGPNPYREADIEKYEEAEADD